MADTRPCNLTAHRNDTTKMTCSDYCTSRNLILKTGECLIRDRTDSRTRSVPSLIDNASLLQGPSKVIICKVTDSQPHVYWMSIFQSATLPSKLEVLMWNPSAAMLGEKRFCAPTSPMPIGQPEKRYKALLPIQVSARLGTRPHM